MEDGVTDMNGLMFPSMPRPKSRGMFPVLFMMMDVSSIVWFDTPFIVMLSIFLNHAGPAEIRTETVTVLCELWALLTLTL